MNKAKLISYIMAGYPDLKSSYELALKLIESGTDILEIGIPFSDPVADGKTIQYAASKALENNININNCLDLSLRIKKKYPNIKIILMGYFNPIYHYGSSSFIKDAIKAGINSLIIVDLPYEEQINYPEFNNKNLPLVNLITPLTSKNRLQQITRRNNEFLYYISVFGITGTQEPNLTIAEENIRQIRKICKNKIALGFGIKKPEQAQKAAKFSDFIVIGSAYLDIIRLHENNINNAAKEIYNFNQKIKISIS
jgi:tryptophan synthase alpha chain